MYSQVLTGHSGGVDSVAWSSDGKWIVSGSDDTLVKIWNAENGALVSSFWECVQGGELLFFCLFLAWWWKWSERSSGWIT